MNDNYKMYFIDDNGDYIEIDGIHEGSISCDEQIYDFIEAEKEISDIALLFNNALENTTVLFKDALEALNKLLHKLKELLEINQKWPIVWKAGMIISIVLKIIKMPP